MKSKVLCLDDDMPILDSYRSFPWEKYGCQLIGLAENGQEGLNMLSSLLPDIILVDIVMPCVDGLEFIRMAREIVPSAVFVIVSAHCDFEYSRQAIRYGVKDYLTKGEFTTEELGTLLTQFSGESREEHPAYRFEISEVLRLIRENLKNDISLESIALQVGLSPNYLGNLFFQQTGERFRDALIRLRMERAKELLLHSPLKIYEIAEQVGIHNPQYFTYLYQKTYGISPAKMRRSTQ